MIDKNKYVKIMIDYTHLDCRCWECFRPKFRRRDKYLFLQVASRTLELYWRLT